MFIKNLLHTKIDGIKVVRNYSICMGIWWQVIFCTALSAQVFKAYKLFHSIQYIYLTIIITIRWSQANKPSASQPTLESSLTNNFLWPPFWFVVTAPPIHKFTLPSLAWCFHKIFKIWFSWYTSNQNTILTPFTFAKKSAWHTKFLAPCWRF